MEAIEIIKAMAYDSALAENSNVWYFDSSDAQKRVSYVFGDFEITDGQFDSGYYLAVWSVDADSICPFQEDNKPDVTLTRVHKEDYDEDDNQIYLWRID